MKLVRVIGIVMLTAGLAGTGSGCQAARRAEGRDAQVDKALSRSLPSASPAEPSSEPRPEFKQEPPGSQ